MPIEPLTALSFAIQSNPGVYGLLLGSGISRAAGIPTGWEMTLDLIRRVAASKNEQPNDVEHWYTETYEAEPDYSALLNQLGSTPSERQAILRNYFEPTEEDREAGRKVPTAAHKAIAVLVSKGFVRVIITTNFDRLLEQALEAEGIMPTVISSADAAEGAAPLAHTRCTLIKIHGDYLDTRIKNTPEELSSYDERLSRLLDRVFDEYGLVICGWSGAWDVALVNAIERTRSRRYTTFWAAKGGLAETAQRLSGLRSAFAFEIPDADTFFKSVRDKVLSIEQFGLEHPLTTIAATATLKRFLQDPSKRIDLHDLVINEARSTKARTEALPVPSAAPSPQSIFERLQQYEAIAEGPIAFFSNFAFFADKAHHPLMLEALRWFASPAPPPTNYTVFLNERLHPAVLVLYGMAVAAISADRPEVLKVVFLDLKVRDDDTKGEEAAILHRLPWQVVQHQIAQTLPGYERHFVPMHDRYFDVLKPMLAHMFPSDGEFATSFHITEVLASLAHLDQRLQPGKTTPWAPAGHFLYQEKWAKEPTPEKLKSEADRDYTASIIGRSGLFVSAERFRIVYQRFSEIMEQYPRF